MQIKNFFRRLAISLRIIPISTDELILMTQGKFPNSKAAEEFCIWLTGKKLLAQEWASGNIDTQPRELTLGQVIIRITGKVDVRGLKYSSVEASGQDLKMFVREELEPGDVFSGMFEVIHASQTSQDDTYTFRLTVQALSQLVVTNLP